WSRAGSTEPRDNKVRLNSTLASALGAAVGQQITLRMQKPSAIPREIPIGRKDTDSLIDEFTVEGGGILHEGDPQDAFNLKPELEPPRLAFVPLALLQGRLGQEGKANALLVTGGKNLDGQLKAKLTLDDWDLLLDTPNSRVAALFARLDRNHDGVLQPRE